MQKSEPYSVNAQENGRRLPPHVAADLGDGTAEGGSGEVVSGARKLGGQALAADWSRFGRKTPINRRGFRPNLKKQIGRDFANF